MAVYRRSTRTRYVLAVLVLAALTLVTIDARSSGTGVTSDIRGKAHDVISPLQRATHAALQPIGNFLTGALDYGSLRRENQRLRDEVAAAQAQLIESSALESEAEQVLHEQDQPFLGSIGTVTVGVINPGSSNFEVAVTVNKGTTSGLALGQPVVAAGGLVGSITAVSSTTAVVDLLTDPAFEVGVRLGTGTLGTVANVGTAQGLGPTQPLRVTVDTTNLAAPKLTKGEPVVTSGLDTEKFPPGIPVGKVLAAPLAPGAAEPNITLAPLVNLNQLSYLLVLLWAPQ